MSTTLLVFLAVVLFAIVVFQLARTAEYVSVLRGEEKAREESDKINARLFLAFLIIGMIGLFWSLYHFKDIMITKSVTIHGQWIDSMFNVTLFFTGVVFILTQVALFYFVWKYKHSKNSVALYYPENNKLEMWWTVIPAIVLTALVVIGLVRWFQITGPEPANSNVIEIMGQQFSWNIRYGGKDGKLGNQQFEYIDDVNSVGIDFNDAASKDDILITGEMHCVVNKPTLLKIKSRDVIHDVGIPWFRVKMDAVPGVTTRFWFTPLKTTEEMKIQTGDPDFVYEIACDQLCGKGHFGMRGTVIVETQDEYDKWIASQKSFYESQVKGQPEEQNFAKLDAVYKQQLAEKAETEKKTE